MSCTASSNNRFSIAQRRHEEEMMASSLLGQPTSGQINARDYKTLALDPKHLHTLTESKINARDYKTLAADPEHLHTFFKSFFEDNPTVSGSQWKNLEKLTKLADLMAALNLTENTLIESIRERRDYSKGLWESPPSLSVGKVNPRMADMLLLAASFFSANQEPQGPWMALQMLQMYGFLVIIPFAGTALVDDVLNDSIKEVYISYRKWQLLAGIATVFFSAMIALKIYTRVRAVPATMSPFRNYTLEAKRGAIEPLLGREDVINGTLLCWQSAHASTRQHPLLVGPPGVGKTMLLMELARRITCEERGNHSALQLLRNKTMFGGTAAQLLPNPGGMDSENKLEAFLKKIEPFKNEVILAIDEVHAFFTEQFAAQYGELIKGVLDTSSRGFPYVIAATTEEEYNRFIAPDLARARRFNVIYVKPLSRSSSKLILCEMASRFFPSVILSETLLDRIQEKSPSIDVSKRLLARAIAVIDSRSSKIPSQDLLVEKRAAYKYRSFLYVAVLNKYVRTDAVALFPPNDLKVIQAKIAEIEAMLSQKTEMAQLPQLYHEILAYQAKEIELIEKQLEQETDLVVQIRKIKEAIRSNEIMLKKFLNQLPPEVRKSKKCIFPSNDDLLKKIIILLHYRLPALHAAKQRIEREMGTPELDIELIDRLATELVRDPCVESPNHLESELESNQHTLPSREEY